MPEHMRAPCNAPAIFLGLGVHGFSSRGCSLQVVYMPRGLLDAPQAIKIALFLTSLAAPLAPPHDVMARHSRRDRWRARAGSQIFIPIQVLPYTWGGLAI